MVKQNEFYELTSFGVNKAIFIVENTDSDGRGDGYCLLSCIFRHNEGNAPISYERMQSTIEVDPQWFTHQSNNRKVSKIS